VSARKLNLADHAPAAANALGRRVLLIRRDREETLVPDGEAAPWEKVLGYCEPGGRYIAGNVPLLANVAPYPHEGSCPACRAAGVCNACGGPAPASTRCTSGRCDDCHRNVCTGAGNPHVHGFGVVGGKHFAADRVAEAAR
jgi:hypothetical protein